jgi:hypothetical protein
MTKTELKDLGLDGVERLPASELARLVLVELKSDLAQNKTNFRPLTAFINDFAFRLGMRVTLDPNNPQPDKRIQSTLRPLIVEAINSLQADKLLAVDYAESSLGITRSGKESLRLDGCQD